MEHTHGLVEIPLRGLELIVGRIKASALHIFIGKSLSRADTGETGLNFLVDEAGFFLGNPGCVFHAAAHGHHHKQEHRNSQQHDQRQFPANGEHHDQRTNDGQRGC